MKLNIYKANFIKNYDGDTITLELDLGFNIFTKMDTRLANVDTKELRGTKGKDKEEAIKAKNFVYDRLINSKEIYVKTFKKDKYGRYAGVIYYNIDNKMTNLCEELLECGLAIPYT
jgi:micrococcal nuclease